MRTHIIEVTNGEQNWGKFLLGQLNHEWERQSEIDHGPLLHRIGYGGPRADMLLVLDLQTREGALFFLTGYARADLDKHKVWVCPMFEPFLEWLYAYYRKALEAGERHWWEGLPLHVDLPDAPFAMRGYRRGGSTET